ncbi:MAG: DUF3570 domain-containing protein [Lentisphaerae bacterium]|nr:DUF3570 domain-containing protein [Lentisphaerota bacterium]
MQVMHFLMRLRSTIPILLALCGTVSAFAGDDTPAAADALSIQFGYYEQDDGSDERGGQPQLDEEAMVYEAIIVYDKALSESDRLKMKVVADVITSASQTREHNRSFRILQSSPSGNKRLEGGLEWQRAHEASGVGANLSFGGEWNAYFSLGYGWNGWRRLSPDGQTVLSGRLQGYTDYFQIKLYDGTEPGWDTRQTATTELGLTHILTPRTILNLTGHYTHQSGYLATTYNSVYILGLEEAELLPSARNRGAVAGRVRRSLSRWNAVELGYRYYLDDWGIDSHTVEARWLQYLFGRRVIIEPNYRFYSQQGARYFATAFSDRPRFRTSDPDLGEFDAHGWGVDLRWVEAPLWPGGARRGDVSLGFSQVSRSDDLELFWITSGITMRF